MSPLLIAFNPSPPSFIKIAVSSITAYHEGLMSAYRTSLSHCTSKEEVKKLPDTLTPLKGSGLRWESVNKKRTQRQTVSSVPHASFWRTSLWIVWTDSSCRLMQELSNVFGSLDGAAEEMWQGIGCQSSAHQSWEARPFQSHKWHQKGILTCIWANVRLLKEISSYDERFDAKCCFDNQKLTATHK